MEKPAYKTVAILSKELIRNGNRERFKYAVVSSPV